MFTYLIIVLAIICMLLTLGIFKVCSQPPVNVENFDDDLHDELKMQKLKRILKQENFTNTPIFNKLSLLETRMQEILTELQYLKGTTNSSIPKKVQEETISQEEYDDDEDEEDDVEGFVEGCTNNCGLV